MAKLPQGVTFLARVLEWSSYAFCLAAQSLLNENEWFREAHMKRYVAGFAFTADRAKVVLIRKNRPAWQAGHLNGIGGKIERGETPAQAMVREAQEEAGLGAMNWEHYAEIIGSAFSVDFFCSFGDDAAFARAGTDEVLEVCAVSDILSLKVIRNVPLLVLLALDGSGLVRPIRLYEH